MIRSTVAENNRNVFSHRERPSEIKVLMGLELLPKTVKEKPSISLSALYGSRLPWLRAA